MKKQEHHFANKGPYKAMVFPAGQEQIRTIQKPECGGESESP